MKTLITLVRREAWEHSAIWLVPVVMSVVLFVLAVMASFGLIDDMSIEVVADHSVDAREMTGGLAAFNFALFGWFAMVMSIVATFYLLDCLLADRKDRSILFWKSLPVSDLKTVLSKLLTAAVLIPLVAFVVSLITHFLLLIVGSVDLLVLGASPWDMLWAPNPIFSTSALVFYAMIVQVLWYLPLMGYLMLISAFAKRAVMVWAVIPPLVIALLEQQLLGTRHFAALIADRLGGVFPLAFDVNVRDGNVESLGELADKIDSPLFEVINVGPLLQSAGFWLGLLAAAGFIAGAVYLRRYGDDSA
jgi:ABC-2 type transport system permease protein